MRALAVFFLLCVVGSFVSHADFFPVKSVSSDVRRTSSEGKAPAYGMQSVIQITDQSREQYSDQKIIDPANTVSDNSNTTGLIDNSLSQNDQTDEGSSMPPVRGGFGGGIGGGGGGVDSTSTVAEVFSASSNMNLENCILNRAHTGEVMLENGVVTTIQYNYTPSTVVGEILVLDCSNNSAVISSVNQLQHFSDLQNLNLSNDYAINLNGISGLVNLRRITLDEVNLNALPVLAVSSLVYYSLIDANLGSLAFSCSVGSSITVDNLDISSNGLTDNSLKILKYLNAVNLTAGYNNFSSFGLPAGDPNCAGLFDSLESIDINNNGNGYPSGFEKKTLSEDISHLVLKRLNLQGSDFDSLPVNLPEVCLELDLSNMANLESWLLEDTDDINITRPYYLDLRGSDGLSCKDSENFRYWLIARNSGAIPVPECQFGIADSEDFANECDPDGELNLMVERSSEYLYHVLNWDALLLEGDYREFEYNVQKRFAGLHDPNTDDGIIGATYQYGEVGSAVISDTVNFLAYEFRVQQCVLNSGTQECGTWSAWVEGDYPLISPINLQTTWADPILGVYYVSWSYPQSYFDGHGQVNYYYLEYPMGNQSEFIVAGSHTTAWQSAIHSIASHGSTVSISACTAQDPETCGPPASIRLAIPPEFGANLTPPSIISAIVDPVVQNEVSITLQNMTPGVDLDNGGRTIIDYYEVTESGPDVRTYYIDISDQFPDQQINSKIKRYAGGEGYEFTFKACVRNRNGVDICSAASTPVTIDLAEPPGFNVITDTLCWVDRSNDGSGLNVQLEWQYSTAGGFELPSHYRINGHGGGNEFVIDHASHTNASGTTVVNQTVPAGNLINDTWYIHGCPDASGSSCQLLGFMPATDMNGVECANPTTSSAESESRGGGGPDDLRPGVWTNSAQLPRQGWTFYWASDLRYDDVHLEYGDTYDLFAYWQTYRFNDATMTWDAVWLYSELKQIMDGDPGDTVCQTDGTGILGFQGALYFPDASPTAADMNVGDLITCFDPEDNNMVDIHLDITMDPGLESGGQQTFTLSEISNDDGVFPPPATLEPNVQDYLNGSFGLNAPMQHRVGKTRLISWSYSFLESLIVLGFDNNDQPMWMNGILDCRTGVTCTGSGVDARPMLADAAFEFRTARLGLPPFAETPTEDGFDNVSATINGILRTKHENALESGEAFEVTGGLQFGFSNDDGVPIRTFSQNFTQTLIRESSFHDIRYWVDDVQSSSNCPIVNGVCDVRFTWFSDADFLGDGTPSIKAFYALGIPDPTVADAIPVDDDLCGAGDPPDEFTVTDYICQIATPGDYQFMLINRVDEVTGLPTANSNIIAVTTNLNVQAEGTTPNDDLGVANVDDVPLEPGVTTHDHDQVVHNAAIGAVAGEAGVSGGAATYSVPINIPPSRQGMQPSVSLNYNSRSGNSAVGVGWALAAGSAISRCPSTIAQDGFTKGVTYGDSDRLCLNGQRLIVVEGDYWATGSRYRTEIDSFVRVTLEGASNAATSGCANTFTVEGKDNIRRIYGSGDSHRVHPDPVSGGSSCAVVSAWLISSEVDPSGNDIRYQYTDYGNGEQLLADIIYTGISGGDPGNRKVHFEYTGRVVNGIEDESISYLAGYRSKQTRMLNNIQTYVGSKKVRQYNLSYITSVATNRLLLGSVEECAYEYNQSNQLDACLPATTFEWGDAAPSFVWEAIETDRNDDGTTQLLVDSDPLAYESGAIGLNGGRLEQLSDFDGDGSREWRFTDLDGEYIASIDAEGVERWRVSTNLDPQRFGTRSNGDPKSFAIGLSNDSEYQQLQVQSNILDYVNSLSSEDLAKRSGLKDGEKLSPAEENQLRAQIIEDLNEQSEDFERVLEGRDQYIDYNRDGVVDLFGIVPDPVDSEVYYFGYALRNGEDFIDGMLEDQFDILPTNIEVPIDPLLDRPFFQPIVGDFNGDGLADVIDRVTLPVTNAAAQQVNTSALRLWINNDNPATDDLVEYEVYADGIPAGEQNSSAAVAGLIYIWPYNIEVEVDNTTTYQVEQSAIPELADYNGDGLVDVVISSTINDIFYDVQIAGITINAILPLGYNQAPVRILLNRADSLGNINFELAELSSDTVATTNSLDYPHSRATSHLGVFSDPRITYQQSLDVNNDGLQDIVFIPNKISRQNDADLCDNNPLATDGCWYLQLNNGGAHNAVQSIYSSPLAIDFQGSTQESMRTNDADETISAVTPEFGNLISSIDWNNDGRSELLIPRQIDKGLCLVLLHQEMPDMIGEYCPVSMNGTFPTAFGSGQDPDRSDLVYGEMHSSGYGHRDRSTYQMGVLEFDLSSINSDSIAVNLIDYNETGIIGSARSFAADGYGDGVNDIISIFGCNDLNPDNVTTLGTNNCITSPAAVAFLPLIGTNSVLDDAGITPYTSGLQSGEFRGYYITKNDTPRDQILDFMVSATDGFLNRSGWSYAPLASNPPGREMETGIPLYVMPNREEGVDYLSQFAEGEYFYFSSSMYVVSQFDESNGLHCDLGAGCMGSDKFQNTTYYGYEEAVYNGLGRGFQGFRKIVSERVVTDPFNTSHEANNNLRNVSVFHQIFPLSGRLEANYSQLSNIQYDPMQDRLNGGFTMPVDTLGSSLYQWGCRIGSGSMSGPGQIVQLCNIDNVLANGIDAAVAQVTENIDGVPGVFQPVLVSSDGVQKEIGEDTIYATEDRTGRSFDAYGNLLGETIINDNLSSGSSLLKHTQISANTYTNIEDDLTGDDDWWLGKLTKSIVSGQSEYPSGNADAEAVKIATQFYDYNTPNVRRPDCEMVIDGDSSLANCDSAPSANDTWTRSEVIYDENGNQTTLTISASDLAQQRETILSYTDDGYFPDSVENAEGHMLFSVIDEREGNTIVATDANQLITRMNYDSFGRLLETWYPNYQINPDAGPDDIDQHYAPRSSMRYTVSCPNMTSTGIAYCVTAITDGSPIVQQAFDSLNREIETRTAGFNGNTIVTSKTYNARGQQISETVPRHASGSTYTSEYLYDALGRIIYKVEPRQTIFGTPDQDIYSHYVNDGLATTVLVGYTMDNPTCVMGSGTIGVGTDLCVKRTYATNGWLLSTMDAHGSSTEYWYDGHGNTTLVRDPKGNDIASTYNNLGFQLTLEDPNMGSSNYIYNGLGEIIEQTDANNITFTLQHDRLGRLLERKAISSCEDGSDLIDEWQYDQGTNRKGLLNGHTRSCGLLAEEVAKDYLYDDFGRVLRKELSRRDPAFDSGYEYVYLRMEPDSYFGRVKSTTWLVDPISETEPVEPKVRMYNKYDVNGYLNEQGDSRQYAGVTGADYNATSPVAWRRILERTPIGQIEEQQYGNQLVQTNQYFDATWQLHNIYIPDLQSGSPALMNYFYEYDLFGNIQKQTSHSLVEPGGDATVDDEQFTYDLLHRLTASNRTHTVGNGQPVNDNPIAYEYDAAGNFMRKSDYANNALYTYGNINSDTCSDGMGGPNAVISVGSNIYRYDCNGNMTLALGPDTGKIISYNPYNKPHIISDENSMITNEFLYDADEQRYWQRKSGSTTVYLDKAYERTGDVHKLYLDDFAVFTIDYENDGQDTGITYLHTDRLGSIAVMSIESGEPLPPSTARGYDPYGRPRDVDWSDDVDGDLNGYEETTRGYTGHEHLNESDLIHMNGRAYDYNLGRFLSVDPYIQAPQNSQSLNPYSYIMNNPLSGTDPSGYTSFGLNGGQCNDFSTGSCVTIIINAPDERANRENGAIDNVGTTNPGGSGISDLGSPDDRSGTDALDPRGQAGGTTSDGPDYDGPEAASGECVAANGCHSNAGTSARRDRRQPPRSGGVTTDFDYARSSREAADFTLDKLRELLGDPDVNQTELIQDILDVSRIRDGFATEGISDTMVLIGQVNNAPNDVQRYSLIAISAPLAFYGGVTGAIRSGPVLRAAYRSLSPRTRAIIEEVPGVVLELMEIFSTGEPPKARLNPIPDVGGGFRTRGGAITEVFKGAKSKFDDIIEAIRRSDDK